MASQIVGLWIMKPLQYKSIGIIVSKEENELLTNEWNLYNSAKILTERAWVLGNVSLNTYINSILSQRFYYIIWTIAIREGFNDKSKSLALIPRTGEIAYPI